MKTLRSLAVGLSLLTIVGTAHAQNLFVISGTSNSVPITPVGADSLIDLVSDAVNNEGQFTGLANTNAVLYVNYGGVADALAVEKNAANDFATLRFINPDGTTTTRTFDANASGRTLEDLIRDYLQSQGAADLASFFQAINARSLIAVSDGNPNATTARMARATFDRFGRYNRQTAMWITTGEYQERSGAGAQFRINASGEAFEAGAFDGTSAMVEMNSDWNFSRHVGTSLGAFVGYNSVGDASVYHGGLNVGVPIRPLLSSETLPLTIQITPHASIGGSGSQEIGAGGLIYSGAVTGLLRWDVLDKLGIDFSGQYGVYEGQELEFGDFKIDPGVTQQIMKLGVAADWELGDQGWYIYGGGTYTDFMEDAAVDSYLTPDIGIGWRRRSQLGTGFEIGFTGDFGDDYSSMGVRFGLNLAF
jgi:hypothetical protein